MFTETLPLFKRICRYADFRGDCTFLFDDQKKVMKYPGDAETRRKRSKGFIRIHSLCFCILLIQFGVSLKHDWQREVPASEKFISFYAIASYLVAQQHLGCCLRFDTEIILYVNGLLQFDQMHGVGDKPLLTFWDNFRRLPLLSRLNTLFAIGIFLSCYIFPVGFVFILHYSSPCKPSLLAYSVLHECNSNFVYFGWTVQLLLKWLILSANTFLWMNMFKLTGFTFAFLDSISITSLRENTALFWKSYRNGSLSIEKLVLMYRQLQILARLGNVISQGKARLVLVAAVVSLNSLFTTTLVGIYVGGRNDAEGIVMSVVSILGILDAALAIVVCIGEMAGVHEDSRKTLTAIGTDVALERRCVGIRRKMKRFLRSCQPLKIYIGSINFIDETTPLHCLDFANDITVNLLLMQ